MSLNCILNKRLFYIIAIAFLPFLFSCTEEIKKEETQHIPVIKKDSVISSPSILIVDTIKKNKKPEKKIIGKDAPEELLEEGEITGTFLNMEWGDHLHFNMKKQNGDTVSFFVLDFSGNRRLLRSMEVNPSYQGKKIKVKWAKVNVYLEAAGRKSIEEKLVDVEEVK